MTQRLAPLLLLLAACGAGGVCAGCGGDDDPGAIPPHFRVTSESKDFDCDGSPSAIRMEFTNADTDAPIYANAPAGFSGCDAASFTGSAWVIRCHAILDWYREIAINATMDGGTVTSHQTSNAGDCTVTGAIVTVEIL